MKVTVSFPLDDKVYEVDFLKLASYLDLTEAQVVYAVQDLLSKA